MDETGIGQPWVDIITPATAGGVGAWWWLGAVAAVLLAALAVYLHYRPRRRALRGLRRLQRRASRPVAVPRDGCQQVMLHLRSALRVSRLESLGLPAAQQADWARYVATLKYYCFAASPPSAAQLQDMARQGRHWLRRLPPVAERRR